MGFLDRLRLTQPSKTARGDSGRGHIDGYLQLEELNNALRGVAGLKIFDEMYRSDPDIRRVVAMTTNPIVGGTWTVEPAGGDEATDEDREVAEFVEWALFGAMRPKLRSHLAEALPVVVRSGFAPFEQVWGVQTYEGREVLVPKSLQLRLPRTIQRWEQDDAGELAWIEQYTLKHKRVTLPAADLVYYRLGSEGDNWEGTSLLRPAYKPWFLKDKIERIDAIAQEREAVGVPIAYPPKQVDDALLDEVETILANVRTNEQGFILSPGPKAEYSEKGEGWTFEILSHKSSEQRSAGPSLSYHTGKIDGAFVAEFMRLGQDGIGARATAHVQENPFLAAVEAVAGQVAEVLNEQLVNRIVALNFEDVEEAPKLKMSAVDSTSIEELSTYVSNLVNSGALTPDPELEDYLRELGKLPAVDPEARKAAAAAPPEPPEPGQAPPAPPVIPAKADDTRDRDVTLPKWGRELRWWEQHMDLEAIDSAINNARNRFQEAAGPKALDLARSYAEAALKGKTSMPSSGNDVEVAISGELDALCRLGRATVDRELDRQRPGVALPGSDADLPAELAKRAKLAAHSIASRVWQAVSRTAISRPGDQAAIQAAGEREAAAALKAEAQLHAAGAVNAGRTQRASELGDEIRGARYTSVLDRASCDPCRGADDDVLRPLTDPVREARIPPNPSCEGGDRCRCLEFFELKAESPGAPGQSIGPPATVDPVPTSSSVAQHFDVSGGSAELRALVSDQIEAIGQVHSLPASLPRIPLQITQMSSAYGKFTVWASRVTGQATDAKIALSRPALDRVPPITSVVHEVGHFLDAFGLGGEVPGGIIDAGYLSGTDAMSSWRTAVSESNAYRQLVLSGGTPYQTSIKELWARSYEQWIALRSGNGALAAKIAARLQEDNPNLYWGEDDFAPIAAAFDEAFAARRLR